MQKSFIHRGSIIYYEVLGKGLPVMLLHGFAEDSDVWHYQVSFLEKHFTLIIPDLPGSGKSQLLQEENTSIEDYSLCVNKIVAQEKIAKLFILGHSMGGYITLAFAERFQEKLLGFGLVHSTAFEDSDEKKVTRIKGTEFIRKHGAYAFIKNTTPNIFTEKFKTNHKEEVAALIEKGKLFEPKALVQYYSAMMNRPERTNILAAATVPVLFIIGEEDSAVPLEDLLKQVNLPNVSHFHILQGAGHMGLWESKDEVNTYILNFLKGCSL
ncbi:MAG: alpha/beta hydrolase [Segetibacter sp.]|nr:alpha/beta hydrolase [Segetibacter sp.]